MNAQAWKTTGMVALYSIGALCIAFFSRSPTYAHLSADQALIKLSFSHAGQPISECRSRSQAELEKLPPNMRLVLDCPRARSPVTIEMHLDRKLLMREVVPPSGLSRDGASTFYARYAIPAREHSLRVKLNDDARSQSIGYAREALIHPVPGQVVVVEFSGRKEGFVIQ